MDEKYACSRCANAGTPICDTCMHVISPGKRENIPSKYTELTTNAPGMSEEARVIVLLAVTKSTIPIKIVMAYNAAIEKRRTEEKENGKA